ncbi:MAG TPA: proline racemase family protein [Jatrophihabitans sp.]|nr:proline racemase family protein [Jatrophihabitans sp.]
MISVVAAHAAGEVGDVIVGGVLPPQGATMFEKKLTMEREHDDIRRLLLREPRGSIARHVNLVLPPTRPDCDAGVIIMEPTEYPPMSGSNTIASVTVMLETGMIPMREPVTTVRLDMPGGLVVATARCENGKCRTVAVENVPAFAHQLDAELDVEGLGPIRADIAYGGMYYAIVDAPRLGLDVTPANARAFVDLADRIRRAAQQQLEIVHPENPGIRDVTMVQFAHPYQGSGAVTPNTCVLAAGRSDRSPTGTGTSARMAVLRARGEMAVGDTLIHGSIIGTEFAGTITADTTVAGRPAIVPTIEGSAWITGFHHYLLDASDPFPEGYLVPDTFGGTALL